MTPSSGPDSNIAQDIRSMCLQVGEVIKYLIRSRKNKMTRMMFSTLRHRSVAFPSLSMISRCIASSLAEICAVYLAAAGSLTGLKC